MKFALVNPSWSFEGSTYFGCQEPHYPLELLFAFDQIRAAGHDLLLMDAHLQGLSLREVKTELDQFHPEFLVIATAPSYLFWRCPPPELGVPQQWFAELGSNAIKVAIGPHPSATPAATLRKLNCQVAMRGESDQTLPQLASRSWAEIDGCCWRDESGIHHASSSHQFPPRTVTQAVAESGPTRHASRLGSSAFAALQRESPKDADRSRL